MGRIEYRSRIRKYGLIELQHALVRPRRLKVHDRVLAEARVENKRIGRAGPSN